MRKIFISIAAIAIICSFFPVDSFAGPWTLSKNKFWMETFVRYYFAKHYWDSDYNLDRWDNGGRSTIWDLEGKFEYGARDDTTLLLGLPYSWGRWRDDGDETDAVANPKHEGFKNLNCGVKYRFMKKPFTAAVQGKIYLQPQAVDKHKAPDLSDYGDALEGRFLIGKSWRVLNGKYCYISGEGGYYWQTDWVNTSEYASYFPILVEYGIAPWTRVMWKSEMDCRISHPGTGVIKDTYTARTGVVLNLIGRAFNAVEKGGELGPEEGLSLNLALQYGMTVLGRGDPENREEAADEPSGGSDKISAAQELIFKVQVLF